ncbi:MAG: ABC-2 family transporter protein [Oligoflexia bacterium]|nr:ABC-2 family transporter protein [Oligoflexia bacterium]
MKVLRYLRLYASLVRFAASTAIVFRADFWCRILMDIAYYATMIGFFAAVFQHTDTLGGFSVPQARVFVAMFLVLDSFHMTVYGTGVYSILQLVRKGDMDYYLLRPVSTLFLVTLREFSLASLLNLSIGLWLLYSAIASYPQQLQPSSIIYGLFLLLNGTFLFYILRVLFIVPVFWTISGDGIMGMFYALRDAAERPHRIYPRVLRIVLMTIVPFALMASVPAELMFRPFEWSSFLLICAVTLCSFLMMLVVWKRALRAYGSASS